MRLVALLVAPGTAQPAVAQIPEIPREHAERRRPEDRGEDDPPVGAIVPVRVEFWARASEPYFDLFARVPIL